MAFSIYEKKNTRVSGPAITATKTGRVAINAAATRIFQKQAVEYALVLWDEQSRRIALRPIGRRDKRAFKVSFNKNQKGASFSAKSFFDSIGVDSQQNFTMEGEWNEEQGQLEFSPVPADRMLDSRQRKLIAMSQ